jgi:DNA-binding NarL/FixJ family response regulator
MLMKTMRVLIVDDLPAVRQGLATMLQLVARKVSPAIEVVGEAQNGHEAVLQAQALHPDVILMDLEMPVLDGLEATRQIKAAQPAPRVIILTIHTDLDTQQRAREAGADDFVVKGASYQILLNAILNRDAENQSFDITEGENL